jgi:transposase InsO family protein
LGLVSVHTIAQFNVHKDKCNEDFIPNVLNRDFPSQTPIKRIVSDLTYVRVGNDWNYICFLIDLYNLEIIRYSCKRHKDAELVIRAFAKVKGPLSQIELFHTDRGLEFKNQKIDKILETFEIKRSLSMKGCPYDIAVAEATYKLIKKEFVYPRRFMSLSQLEVELDRYMTWFNTKRIHSTLDYKSPVDYKTPPL